jgi:hypothetical protein
MTMTDEDRAELDGLGRVLEHELARLRQFYADCPEPLTDFAREEFYRRQRAITRARHKVARFHAEEAERLSLRMRQDERGWPSDVEEQTERAACLYDARLALEDAIYNLRKAAAA